MAYNYYQTAMPGWGTSHYQFGSPPAPQFQPQPSWTGLDFYNAHAVNPDPGLFHSVMSRLRDFAAPSVSHSDARHWHKRVYSGMVRLNELLPADVGGAAAYEAYRTFKHNTYLYEPLSADRESQRESLIGMAIAEATRLWAMSGRPYDTYGQRAACEAAAQAGSVLAERLFSHSSSFLRRTPSFSGSYDEGHTGRTRRYSTSTPSVVRVGGSPYMGGSPYLPPASPSMPMAVPSSVSSYGGGMPGSYGSGLPGSYGAGMAGTYGAGVPGSYTAGMPGSYGAGMPASYGAPGVSYSAGAPMSYGAPGSAYGDPNVYNQGYATSQTPYRLAPGQQAPPGSTVIIVPRRSRRHSSSGRHHHHRSHSMEPREYRSSHGSRHYDDPYY